MSNDIFPKLFEEIFENPESIVFNNLVRLSLENSIYVSLVFLDFTYINKQFQTLDPGTELKNNVLSLIHNDFNNSNGNTIYYSQTASKIFIFTKKPIDNIFKQNLDKIQLDFDKKYEVDGKKLIYIVDKKIGSDKYFSIGPYQGSFEELFNIAYKKEIKLKDFRTKLNNYFKDISNLANNNEFDGNINVGKIEKEIKKIDKRNEDFIHYFNSDNGRVDLHFENINYNDESQVNQFFATISNNIDSSGYLFEAIKAWRDGAHYHDEVYYKNLGRLFIAKYLIWEELQELQLIGYKIEKIYPFFNRVSNNNPDTLKNVVKINEPFDLMRWYESSIKVFFPMMTSNQKKLAEEIWNLIENLNKNSNNIDYLQNLRDKIHYLIDDLNIKGVFSIPLEKIEPSYNALEFFKYQLYYSFGSEYKNKLQEWFNNISYRKGYYITISEPAKIYEGLDFINSDIIEESNSNVKEDLKIHVAFLEIDGFNAFNTYFFPSDTDHIAYQKIINNMFEISLSYIKSHNELFKRMITSILGDEFFYVFLTNGDLKQKDHELIRNYLNEIRSMIVDVAKDIYFPYTDKIALEVEDIGKVTFREIQYDKRVLFSKRRILIDIGNLKVSGVVKNNIDYIPYTNSQFSVKDYEDNFKTKIKDVENQMDIVKADKQKRGSLFFTN